MMINVDGHRISVERFMASKGLQVQGSLYLSDCPSLKNVFRAGKDRRGYEFFGVRLANGWRVIAGCRNFSLAEAREHWADNRECLALAERVIAADPADTKRLGPNATEAAALKAVIASKRIKKVAP